MWHRAFLLGSNVAQSFFVRFRYNLGLDLSVVRMGLCAMNLQKFGVKRVCRCAAGAWSYFRLSQSIGICPPVGENTSLYKKQKCFFCKPAGILPVFYSFYCTEPKGLKNNGMTQSLQNPGVLQRQNSSGLFYSKTGLIRHKIFLYFAWGTCWPLWNRFIHVITHKFIMVRLLPHAGIFPGAM